MSDVAVVNLLQISRARLLALAKIKSGAFLLAPIWPLPAGSPFYGVRQSGPGI